MLFRSKRSSLRFGYLRPLPLGDLAPDAAQGQSALSDGDKTGNSQGEGQDDVCQQGKAAGDWFGNAKKTQAGDTQELKHPNPSRGAGYGNSNVGDDENGQLRPK